MTATIAAMPAPRENPELIGHAAAERALAAAAASDRLPHAWLLGGPAGIGKATLAFRFARHLLAGGAEQEGPGLFGEAPREDLALDPQHPVFRRVAAAGHADLLTVERPPADEKGKRPQDLPVEAVRRIAPFLRLTAAEGGWRVVVVDEAERMNRNSANALLKVLEEPPARAVLILVSSRPGALLPTIRSRCRRLALEPLPEADLIAFLRPRVEGLSPDDLQAVARLAAGSPGRALALVEEGGLDLYRGLIELIATLPRLDRVAVHRLGDKLAAPAAEQAWRTVTALFDDWLSRLVRAHARGAVPELVLPAEAEVNRRLAGAPGLERWLEVWEKTHRLFARADSANLDRKQVLLQAFTALEEAARA
ncbi:MAG: DNA polymerase III subunit delta' [Inquilinus sp.]|nr:DNA polymerase III subunit delta' [Inquilinus sp.]